MEADRRHKSHGLETWVITTKAELGDIIMFSLRCIFHREKTFSLVKSMSKHAYQLFVTGVLLYSLNYLTGKTTCDSA
jgi:hypothetical protein